ncbi:O-acyltransferase WSD1-like [Ananas comosus]|uniref:O-acyltransferase WSD1-like n=1 Tax=Ananas comosus TaxID=4615 RepID=A0A6P5EWZ9_ANACO|nr:O-acyltransferase WSD1-like [Ananas comosus]
MNLQVKVRAEREEEEEKREAEENDQPVSPTGQYFNSSALSVSIMVVFESEIPIDDSPTMSTLENLLLPINPRFSSIMVKDEKGVQHWRKVKVNLEDHVNIPVFPSGLAAYDEHVEDYLSKMAAEPLPLSRPLWEIHIIKYATRHGEGSLVFKLHHALGDGFSLMGALFSCLQRADDPSLPLTFPTRKVVPKKSTNRWQGAVRVLSACVDTVRDFGWSMWKSRWGEDDVSAVRSEGIGHEFRPISISTVEFELEQIRRIKAEIGGTINDIISGIVFYGIQLYIQAMNQNNIATATNKVTALVLLNTRNISSYQSVDEMTKPNARSPWGNQFGFMHVSLPTCANAESADPLYFVLQAKKIIKAKRNSLVVYLTGRLLETLRRIKGPEATARYIHGTLRNTSMTVSNLTGPIEQMIIAGHPVKSFHFMVVRVPQSLTITVVSYMGKLKVALGVEKGFINSQLLNSYMKESFERILEAAKGKRN